MVKFGRARIGHNMEAWLIRVHACMRQGKAPRTVSKQLLDSVAAGGDAEQPSIAQLASDFQLGPPGSVRLLDKLLQSRM